MNLLVKIIILTFILISSAYAENFICYDSISKQVKKSVQGDCKNLGICSDFNNQGMNQSCFLATNEESNKAQQQYVKVDMSIIVGSRVVDMTQAEIDVINAQILQQELDRLALLDTNLANEPITGVKLQRVEQAIDNIGNLNDAKAFLKKLVRYLSDSIPAE